MLGVLGVSYAGLGVSDVSVQLFYHVERGRSIVRSRVDRSKPSSISLERTTIKLATPSRRFKRVLSAHFSRACLYTPIWPQNPLLTPFLLDLPITIPPNPTQTPILAHF